MAKPLQMFLASTGGVGSLAYQMVQTMSTHAQAVHVVLLSPNTERMLELSGLPHVSMTRAYASHTALHRFKSTLGILISTFIYTIKHRPASVFCWGREISLFYMVAMWLCLQRPRVSMFSSSHTTSHLASMKPLKRTILGVVYRFILPRTIAIGAQTDAMADDLVHNFCVDKARIILTPPFTVQRFFDDDILPTEQRRMEIVFIGRLAFEKNLSHLLHAFSMARATRPNIHLRLVGDGNQRADLEKMTHELKIDDAVIFTGAVRDTKPYYQHAMVLAICSLFEGFPLVIGEAMACGTPVVSYDFQSGPRDILLNGVNGFLVENQNVDAFARALILAFDTAWQRDTIRNHAKKWSVAGLTPAYDALARTVRDLGTR